MRMFIHLFSINFKRAVFSLRFVICASLVFLAVLLTIAGMISPIDNTIYLLDISLGGSYGNLMLILGTLPILDFAITFATDWEQKTTSFWMIRTGVSQYALNKVIVSAISAFLVTLVGLILFLAILSIWLPLYETGERPEGYFIFLMNDQPLLYIFFRVTHIALTSSMFAVVGLWMSTLIPNKYVTVAAPVVLYFMAHRATNRLAIPEYLKAVTFVEGVYDAGSPILSLLLKFVTVLVIILPLSYFTIRNMKRRVQHD